MNCEETLRTQAYLDGELNAMDAADIEAHLEQCAACQAQCEAQSDIKALLAQASYHRAPPQLRANIAHALDQSVPRRRASFWTGFTSGAGGMALAACLAMFMLLQPSAGLVDTLVAAHLNAIDQGRPIQVASSDHHTVKPWFAGHADVSPPVTDFAAQGFTLVGGRSDEIAGQRAAVVIYRHGRHLIALFAWAGNRRALPADTMARGYHVLLWKERDLNFAAVSDTQLDELRAFTALIKKTAGPE